MKYGLMRFSDEFDDRKDKPSREVTAEKCCAKCFHWIEANCKDNYYGQCCAQSDDEWDLFSWADDCCPLFEQDLPDDEKPQNGVLREG